jgi:hypothetical protein
MDIRRFAPIHQIANGRRNAAIQIEGGGSCVGVEINTVGQFVGCKDLYGTEIYEGDIIEGYRIGEHQSGKWIIEVASNLTARARKFGKWENHDSRDYCGVNEVKCRVVGNKHDNKQLY